MKKRGCGGGVARPLQATLLFPRSSFSLGKEVKGRERECVCVSGWGGGGAFRVLGGPATESGFITRAF